MSTLRQNLAYTFRRFFKSPVFVFAVIVSIGLGIGANATIFSMISRFVLRGVPVGDPSTLLTIYTTHDHEQCCNNFTWPLYNDIRQQAKSFSGVAAFYELLPASIGGKGDPERVWGQAVTANYFDVAQLRMPLGRGFTQAEEHQPAIVLSHRLWQRRFSADPSIVGKSINLSGRSFTVVGIAPQGFRGLDFLLDPEFWVSFGNVDQLVANLPDHNSRNYHWVTVAARLKPGVTREQANAELATLAQNYAKAYPATDKGNGFRIEQAGSLPPRDKSVIMLFLGALMVVVLLVLCIACANVANLLLAQTASRQREMAVRIALGATRGQLLRQMLTESILLAIGGGLFGILLSLWATSALSAFSIPAPVPLATSIRVDWPVIGYTFVLSAIVGFLFGIVPAWIASRPVLSRALKGEDALARPGRRFHLRSALVVAQITLSLILLCATGLFLRSLERASSIPIGFRSNGLLMMSVDPAVNGYTPEHTVQFLHQLRDRLSTIPGVLSVVATDTVPLSGGNRSDGIHAVGHKSSEPDPIVELYMATPGYFQTMGISMIAGRDFTNESTSEPKVAVIDEVLAKRLFGNDNPVGQQVADGDVTLRIIGVVKNIKSRTLGEETRPALYRSLDQTVASDPAGMGYTLVVRPSGGAAGLAAEMRRQVAALDPTIAVYNVATIEEHLKSALFLPRLAGTLFGVFGFTGLILAAVGLYGVMSYSVSRRIHEIGIRIALGAQLAAIRRLFLVQGMLLTLVSLALGVPIAFVLAKFSASFLYGIQPHDILTFATVPIFLMVVALSACWLPARRATKIDPQAALRYE